MYVQDSYVAMLQVLRRIWVGVQETGKESEKSRRSQDRRACERNYTAQWYRDRCRRALAGIQRAEDTRNGRKRHAERTQEDSTLVNVCCYDIAV